MTDAEHLIANLSLPEDLSRALEDPRYWRESVCRLLFKRVDALASSDFQKYSDAAKGVCRLVDKIPRDANLSTWLSLKARSLILVGAGSRLMCEFDQAEISFRIACSLYGYLSPVERGDLFRRYSILRKDQRRLSEAIRLANVAIEIFEECNSAKYVGYGLLDRGNFLYEMNRLREALDDYQEALCRLEGGVDSRGVYSARHNIVMVHVDLFDGVSSSRHLEEMIATLRNQTNPNDAIDLLKVDWLAARFQRKLGNRKAARDFLWRAMNGFRDLRMPFEAALVMLDLAELYLINCRYEKLMVLAGETFSLFRALRVNREAFYALSIFHEAIVRRDLSSRIIDSIREMLANTSRRAI